MMIRAAGTLLLLLGFLPRANAFSIPTKGARVPTALHRVSPHPVFDPNEVCKGGSFIQWYVEKSEISDESRIIQEKKLIKGVWKIIMEAYFGGDTVEDSTKSLAVELASSNAWCPPEELEENNCQLCLRHSPNYLCQAIGYCDHSDGNIFLAMLCLFVRTDQDDPVNPKVTYDDLMKLRELMGVDLFSLAMKLEEDEEAVKKMPKKNAPQLIHQLQHHWPHGKHNLQPKILASNTLSKLERFLFILACESCHTLIEETIWECFKEHKPSEIIVVFPDGKYEAIVPDDEIGSHFKAFDDPNPKKIISQ